MLGRIMVGKLDHRTGSHPFVLSGHVVDMFIAFTPSVESLNALNEQLSCSSLATQVASVVLLINTDCFHFCVSLGPGLALLDPCF